MSDLEYLCTEVRRIARAAGVFLKKERETFDRNKVEEKSAHNYVSYVDKASEEQIIKQLHALLPEAGVLAEEGTGSLNNNEYYWVIDPLDGTSNYIHDMAPYCVSIALCGSAGSLLGVVYEVHRDECFYATAGGGAYLDGKPIHVSGVTSLDNAFIALGFPYNSDAYHDTACHLVKKLYGQAGGTRLLGSAAAELCYVAAGRFDARIEAHLGTWDVAAGGLIVERAGGKMSDFRDGSSWLSGDQVIASNGKLHQTILGLLP